MTIDINARPGSYSVASNTFVATGPRPLPQFARVLQAQSIGFMMVGGREISGGASEQEFRAQWSRPAVEPEMRRLGLERPEQLGALFIGDATFIRALLGNAQALTDDMPKLIEAPFSSRNAGAQLLAQVTDTAAARTRFETSPLVTRLWPPALAASSVPYFDIQRVVDAHMYGNLVASSLALEDVHRVLTGSTVATPVLWRLGSNSDIQRVVSAATSEELMNPLLQYHLAIRLLSERNYRPASDAFERATQSPQVRDNAFVLYVYALCMAQLRAKGIQSYGIGPASTEADAINYPAHGDVERLAESSLYPFVQYVWNVVTEVAAHK